MANNLEAAIRELALPLIEAQGLELWGLDVIKGPTLKVALYVDKPLAEDGGEAISASIEQCEAISRQLGLALDVENCIEQPWVLEVSSPGLERRFFSISQMKPYVGDVVDVKLKDGTSPRKAWRGELLQVGNDEFEIQPCSISDDGIITPEQSPPQGFKWDDVRNVHRLYVYTPPQKPGKSAAARKKSGKK